MLRDYKDKRIYRNLRIIKKLFVVSLIWIALCLLAEIASGQTKGLFTEIAASRGRGMAAIQIFVRYAYWIFVPFSTRGERLEKNTLHKRLEEKAECNDLKEIRRYIVNSYWDFILLGVLLVPAVIIAVVGAFGGSGYIFGDMIIGLAEFLGAAMASHIFVFISGGFYIHTYVLVKRDWEENPPQFYKPDWKKAEERAQLAEDRREEREARKEEEHYRRQIEICGARFFIKYYRQAKRLPLRDVKVTENYSSAEREERLEAVRELIDSGQSEYALQRILEEYGDVLDDSEVQDAKALLAEIEKENHTEDEK